MSFLLLALLFSTLIMVNFKLYPRFKIDAIQAIVVNYFIASVLGSLSMESPFSIELAHQKWSNTALLSGFFLITVFFVFSASAAKVGIAVTSVSSKMSVIIPVILGLFLFNESISIFGIIGIALAFPAFFLIFYRKKTESTTKKIYFFLPLLLFLGNGTNDSLLKYAQYNFLTSNNDLVSYLVFAFSISMALGLLLILYRFFILKIPFSIRSMLAGIILGTLNWFSTYFFLAGLSIMDVSVFVPIFNLGIVVLGSLSGVLLFKEKIKAINWLGYCIACIAIFLIAFQS